MHQITQFPAAGEFDPYFVRYISRVPKGDLLETLATQMRDTLALIRSLPEDRGGFRYASDKWTIREMLGHVIDAERIFAHRALTIARADPTPLPSFDENAYARASQSDARTLGDLADELEAVRRSTIALFGSFDDETVSRRGIANNKVISVRALAFIIAGHELHHVDILRTRYLAG